MNNCKRCGNKLEKYDIFCRWSGLVVDRNVTKEMSISNSEVENGSRKTTSKQKQDKDAMYWISVIFTFIVLLITIFL